MLIKNMGLFWRAENVHWGKGKNSGHLKGVHAWAKRSGEIDFREQQGVYVLYDVNFSIVYIGQSGAKNDRLFKRIKQHTRDQLADRWSRFSWFGVRGVDWDNMCLEPEATENYSTSLSGLLNHIEAILITAAEPPHNRQGGRFGNEVERYLQYRDVDNLGPSMLDMVRHLYNNSE